MVVVAQLVRASDCGSEGRRFEPGQPPQKSRRNGRDLFYTQIMNYWLIIIPVTSALIGWIANRVLIKLLFHPREPKKIFGFSFQGILPKRQKQLAERIGKMAGQEFLSFNSIEEKINDPRSEEHTSELQSHV